MRRDPHLFSEPLAYFNGKGDCAADAPFEFSATFSKWQPSSLQGFQGFQVAQKGLFIV